MSRSLNQGQGAQATWQATPGSVPGTGPATGRRRQLPVRTRRMSPDSTRSAVFPRGGAAAAVAPFQGVGIVAFAAVDHKARHLVGNVRGDVGGDGAGAADGFAGLHQGGGRRPLGGRG